MKPKNYLCKSDVMIIRKCKNVGIFNKDEKYKFIKFNGWYYLCEENKKYRKCFNVYDHTLEDHFIELDEKS